MRGEMEIVLSLLSAYGPEQSPSSSRVWHSFSSLLPRHSVLCLASWCPFNMVIYTAGQFSSRLLLQGV